MRYSCGHALLQMKVIYHVYLTRMNWRTGAQTHICGFSTISFMQYLNIEMICYSWLYSFIEMRHVVPDIFKAQHGCIDSFALMILEELESGESIKQRLKFIKEIQEDDGKKNMQWRLSILELHKNGSLSEDSWFEASVINLIPVEEQRSILHRIITTVVGQKQTIPFLSNVGKNLAGIMLTNVAFRICMANVLIRAAQKVTIKHREFFVSQVVSPVLHFLEVSNNTFS